MVFCPLPEQGNRRIRRRFCESAFSCDDGAGRNTEMMSEFLMTYLLRDMLGRKLAVYGEFDDITDDSFELPDADLNDDDDGKGETKQ